MVVELRVGGSVAARLRGFEAEAKTR